MSRHVLLPISALLLATSAHAFDFKSAVSAEASASVQAPTAKDAKDAATKTGQASRDSAISAGLGALTAGKTAAESGKAAAQAAKDTAVTQATAAKDAAVAKAGLAQNIAAGYKQDAAKMISVKDRVAVAKFAATQKATGKAVSKLSGFLGGANAQSNGGLAKGYEKKLVIGAKLDAGLAAQAQTISNSTVTGLGTQPKDTQLLLIGNQVVRVDVKTQVVLDVGTATL